MGHWSEFTGQGDLRLFIAVQFYPMLVAPLILLMFPSRYGQSRPFLLVWALYALAKICELLDAPIYALGQYWSGHTLKHLIAAAATYCLLHALRRRRPLFTAKGQIAGPPSSATLQPPMPSK